jgi:hypothetical protein
MSLDTYSLQFPFIVLSSVDPVESEPGIARPRSNFCCACGVQEVWKCTRPRLERKRHESMFVLLGVFATVAAAQETRKALPSHRQMASGIRVCRVRNRQKKRRL